MTARRTTQRATGRTTQRSTGRATQRSTGRATQRSTGRTTQRSTGRATQPATGRTTQPATGRTTQPATGRATQPATGRATQPATGRATQPATGRATQPATGRATQPATGRTTGGDARRAATPRRQPAGAPHARSRSRAGTTSRLTRTLVDHDEIRRWAESRSGTPAAVTDTSRAKNDVGMIRLDFPGYSGEGKLQAIGWDEWFEKFDASNLALLVQEKTAAGEISHFNKLVAREGPAPRTARRPAGSQAATRR
jgi:hypothetical protein